MNPLRLVILIGLLCCISTAHAQSSTPAFRPPSVPLVAHDPYFSIWSAADELTAKNTVHWTGKPQAINGLIRIDGKAYRIMGSEPAETPALPQVKVQVLPTRTIYDFKNEQVAVTLAFLTPALPEDIDVLSRPATYLSLQVQSVDGAEHGVQWYQDASGELSVSEGAQEITWDRSSEGALVALRFGSTDQPVLARKGDDLRIDWGHLYLAAAKSEVAQSVFARRGVAMDAWTKTGRLPAEDDAQKPRPANSANPVAVLSFDFGKVGATAAGRTAILAYDDEYSLTFMGRKLRPYWRRNGADAAKLLASAATDFVSLQKRCALFDEELLADAKRIGGDKYAQIVALAHRQAFAANKIVADANGAPLMMSKENFSNGCIATVDVLYPAAPQLLLLSPILEKATLMPELLYGASSRWKWPFAPHDLGTYPRADGQVYGGGERTEENQMPVEETGNLLILLGAIAKIDDDSKFSDPFWPQISKWAKYVESKGFDPENQLCTDDFAGHLAHNVNLSAKAIEALGAYSILCDLHGEKEEAIRVRKVAQEMAARWAKEAKDDDHYRLAFDKPNSWSQKYNLVWDRILGLNLFAPEVFQQEMAFYRKSLNRYGLPLDNRKNYTKLDWTVWTATLTGKREDFEALVAPIYDYLNDTRNRNPMSDWYETKEPRQSGFQARSVVGGVFIPFLDNPGLWKKWADRDRKGNASVKTNWAPLPTPPKVTELVPTSERSPVNWKYTFEKPADNWFQAGFDDAAWKSGPGGFGTTITPNTKVRTEWKTDDIWARRDFSLPAADSTNLNLVLYHDEDAEVYVNGVLAAKLRGFNGRYDTVPMSAAARRAVKPGQNTLSVHCHQTRGGQYIDVGLATVEE